MRRYEPSGLNARLLIGSSPPRRISGSASGLSRRGTAAFGPATTRRLPLELIAAAARRSSALGLRLELIAAVRAPRLIAAVRAPRLIAAVMLGVVASGVLRAAIAAALLAASFAYGAHCNAADLF